MILIVLLAMLALSGIVATVVNICNDGYRPVPTNWTRVAEYGVDERSPRKDGSARRRLASVQGLEGVEGAADVMDHDALE